MTNLENENPFKSPKRLSQSPGHLTSPTRLQKSPSFKSFSTLSPVQKLIQQKEKDAINNNAEDIPVLPQSPTRFGSPLRSPTRINKSPSSSKLNNLASPVKNRYPYSNDTILGNKHGSPKSEDHLSKSQIKRMNQINSSISNSPSIKSLKKLVSVENKIKEKNFSKVEPVHGLQSRVRLKKDISQNDISSISSSPKRNLGANNNWMDADRESLQYLEFLSRIEEAKLWIESCLDETIELSENGDSLVDFQDYLRNGIILAKLVKLFDPSSKFKIFYGGKSAENTEYKSKSGLNFRFTENINVFIKFLNKIKLPDMFIFETRDLFEMKDFPKVVFCIHALSYLLAYHEKAPSLTKIDNMSSSVTESDIKKVQSKIRGVRLPNFEDIDEGVRVNADLGITPADFSFINQKDDDENDASFFANAKTNITKSGSRMEDIKENDDEENSIDNSEISSDNIAGGNSDILDNTETNETETENDNNESISDNTESVSDNLDEFSNDKIDDSTVERYNKIIKKYDTSYIQRSPDTSKVFDFNDISSIASNEDLFNNIEDIQMKYSSISAIDDKELRTSVMEIMTGKRQKKFDDTIDYTERLNELEAIARGSLYRFELKVNRLMLKTFTPDTIALQSIIRGNAIRKNLKTTQNKLTANSRSLSVLQAILKSRIKEDVTAGKKMYLKIYEDEIINLQSIIRKKLLKNSIFKQKKILFLNTSKLIILQSKIRGNYVRNNFQDICNIHNESLQNNRQKSKRKPVPKLDEDTERHLKEFNDKQNKAAIDKATLKCIPRADKYQILELQSVIRGSIVRNRINRLFDRMLICEDCVTSLNSIARAKLARKELKETVVKLQNSKNSVILIQSAVRSVLCRFSLDVMLDDLEDEEESINKLQAIIRGNATRKLLKDRMEYFNRSDNVRKIVKLQSFIRANNEGSAFKSLIHESNPPFKAVKHFIGLLRGNDSQVEDELAIKKYQEEILTECKKIEVLEGNLTDLSNKIKILKRNNVDIIDITKIKQKNKELIDEYSKELDDNLRKSIGPGSSTSQDRKSDDAIQAIERFLFVLQSKPEYLARVFKAMDEDVKFGRDKPNISGVGSTTNAIKILLSSYNDGEYDFEELVIKLFNYSGPTASTSIKPSRDEFLYLKLIIACLHNSVSSYQDIHEFKSEFKRSTVFKNIETSWKSLLLRFTLLPQYRKYTKSVFGDAILLVTSNEDAWFESNPEVIKDELDARANIYGDDDDDVYDDTDRNYFDDVDEKLGPGKQNKSTNPFDDERVASQFVNNSTELRSTVQDVLRIVSSHVQQIPISVRIICKEYFNALKIKFPGESERFYLSCVGEIFSKCYISKFFLMPENFGINIESAYENPYISERVKQNLFEVAKVFNQVMLMRAFGKNNLLLQPLNEFIQDCVSPVRMFLRELIDVDSLEVEFSMNPIYDDLTSASKPKLRMIFIDDYLKNVTDLFALSKGHIDFSSLKSDGYLLFELKPTTETAESLDKWEEKSLMAQAKCYLTYIIQIQDGEDLVDVLTSKTSNQQEYAFQELVIQDSKNKDKYQTIEERKFLDNIHKLSFYKVKKRGLQLVLELEQLGLTTRNDGYQSILNEIANDIKHKKSQKEERARKLKVVVGTLTKLKEKERSCTTFYQEYNSHFEQSMVKLQSKSSTKKKGFFAQLFSSQNRFQRKLARDGVLPKYGSYIYQSRALFERNILQDVSPALSEKEEISSSFFSSSTSSFKSSKLSFIFSCNKQNEFFIEVRGSSQKTISTERLTLDDILKYQYDNKRTFKISNGNVTFNTDEFAKLIFKKFYHIKE
ncbi:unnamed protein product [[Candida] boidinii]|nr:unnamed protein product [[Candida] boidinii]